MVAVAVIRYGRGDDASRLTLARNTLRGNDGDDTISGDAVAVFEGIGEELGTTRASNLIFAARATTPSRARSRDPAPASCTAKKTATMCSALSAAAATSSTAAPASTS